MNKCDKREERVEKREKREKRTERVKREWTVEEREALNLSMKAYARSSARSNFLQELNLGRLSLQLL